MTVELLDMAFLAHIGCFEEEQRVGTRIVVDITAQTHDTTAVQSDRIEDALDYSVLYQLIASQVERPCHLLEHLAGNILKALSFAFDFDQLTVSVSKLDPAVGGRVGRAKVTLSLNEL